MLLLSHFLLFFLLRFCGMVSFFLIPVVVKSLGIKSGYVGADMVRFHPAVLLATILLVGVTIFLASQKPTKMAADISPIEALGYRPTHKTKIHRQTGCQRQQYLDVCQVGWYPFS